MVDDNNLTETGTGFACDMNGNFVMLKISVRALIVFFFACAATIAQAQEYVIDTFAGGGRPPTPVLGLDMRLTSLQSAATDAAGNAYFIASDCVFKLDLNGVVTRIAGIGRAGYSGDGGPATRAQLPSRVSNSPPGMSGWASANFRPALPWTMPETSTSRIMATIASAGFLPMESSPPSRATVRSDSRAMGGRPPTPNCPPFSAWQSMPPAAC